MKLKTKVHPRNQGDSIRIYYCNTDRYRFVKPSYDSTAYTTQNITSMNPRIVRSVTFKENLVIKRQMI
jgi:hypothetical protein